MNELRSFLDRLEEAGELRRIRQPVELEYEIGAVCFKELQSGIEHNQALFFEQVKGSSMPLVTNLLGSPRRFLLALDLLSPQDWHKSWSEKTAHPINPVQVNEAPCQQVRSHQAKLEQIPIPLWNEKDGGHYLTMACVISKDPETHQRNCGIYRMMVHEDWRSTGVLAPAYRHIAIHLAKSAARREPLPVAVAIGVAPALIIAAAADFPYGVDEFAMAGGLQGKPLEIVGCQSVPLEVPAGAEIILEGSITPGDEKAEGPFGEFTGYYSGERTNRPVFQINCISHRKDPIAVGSYVGRPPQENSFLNAQTTAAEIMRQCPLPGIVDLHVNPLGVLNAVVSIQKSQAENAKKIAAAILSTDAGRRIKTVVVVDQDIDPRNHDQVSWAMAYRVRPERDVEIVKGMIGVAIDPALSPHERLSGTNRTSKLIVDATTPRKEWIAEECLPKKDLLERVEAEWDKFS